MREKLHSLPMSELREIAKANGIKSVTTMRKESLIDKIIECGKKGQEQTTSSAPASTPVQPVPAQPSAVTAQVPAPTVSERTTSYVRRDEGTAQNRQWEKPQQMRNDIPGKIYISPVCPDVRLDGSLSPEEETRQLQADIYDASLDSGVRTEGILEIMSDGFGFIRCENYMPGDNDVYVAPAQIKRYNLKTGDIICGRVKVKAVTEKFAALLYIESVNGLSLGRAKIRKAFEDLTPIFPNERIRLETERHNTAMRIVDLVSPIGKGQRGMIVAQPKAGKTTLLKEVAKSVTQNNPEMHMIILLIDERPEEVTDIKEAIEGKNVEVIYSTFDELPEHHKRVSEMVIERAKRLVEHGKEVIILLDSITRLARAYNMVVPASGRTLSGGLDPAALHMPKRFFGAARNMREGGSLTILATALVDTGSRMDDVVYEEFKGTGNMELILDRKLSEKRVFPAIDIVKSGTRREDLLLDENEKEAVDVMRKATNSMKADEAVEHILDLFAKTKNNSEFCQMVKKTRLI
ncbi:MAG: transcription termination factor Rho [Lachnospiraceae bacterium]|nr:transcription termination factor Rho [Lachnospiraceae bacterium]